MLRWVHRRRRAGCDGRFKVGLALLVRATKPALCDDRALHQAIMDTRQSHHGDPSHRTLDSCQPEVRVYAPALAQLEHWPNLNADHAVACASAAYATTELSYRLRIGCDQRAE